VLSATANPAGLQPGAYATHIDVSVTQATNGGLRIPVNLTIQNTVEFNVDPVSVAVDLSSWLALNGGAPPSATLTLSSQVPVTYQISSRCSGELLSGTAPGPVTVGICGTYGQFGFDSQYFTIATSSNQVAEVPFASVEPGLYPLIEPGGIVNGATFTPGPVAPGSIVSIFGVDLASSVSIATSLPLAGSQATLSGSAPPKDPRDEPGTFYSSATQWNVQIPVTLLPGKYQFSIGGSAPVSFEVAATAPYIFVWDGTRAAALNQDYTLNQPGNPAMAGSAIMVYLTGQGAVDPPVPTRFGAPSNPLSRVTATATATIDGQPADVLFAGLAPGFAGVGQVDVVLPDRLPAGGHQLIIAIGGVNSNQVEISSK
jgi:adhesin/invasin